MAVTSFDELVKQEQKASKAMPGKFDAFKERDEWLDLLENLYREVEAFLADYVRDGSVKISYSSVEIIEEQVGSYEANSMIVAIGRKTVRLDPIGTFLIGTKGRVDVVGPRSSGRLTLLNRDVKNLSQLIHVSIGSNGKLPVGPPPKDSSSVRWVWRIIGQPPRMEIQELTKDHFLSLLAEVANG